MRNIIATIAVLLSVCANAQYKETLHATIGPTNTVVTSIPDWAKSDTPPQSGLSSNEVVEIINFSLEGFATEADLLAFYYPDGSVTSMDQITANGINYAVGNDGGAYVTKGEGLSGHVVLPWKVAIDGKEYKVTAIGENAFNADYSSGNRFNSFTAPITVKSIGDYAFYFFDYLESASITSATNVGNGAFSYCHSLEYVSIPSATSIGNYAFTSCNSLTSVSIPYTTSIGIDAFSDCSNLKSANIPSAISIGNSAFYYCNSLTSVSIPSATSIGNYAFLFCYSLTSVDFGSSPKSSVPSLSAYAFNDVPTTCRFIIPLGMYDDWISAPNWSTLYAAGYKFEGYASTEQVKALISAENQSFSNAVLSVGLNIDTNSVAVLNDIAEAFGGFPIEGTATTVGSLLAALAAAVAWLKKNKADKATTLPKYDFVNAAITDGVVTVATYTNAKLVSDGTAFSVVIGGENGYTRDCVLRVECGETAPKITWGDNFHPRTDAETDFACVAGVRNIYWITEYAPNEFCVAGWQETTGGNAQ